MFINSWWRGFWHSPDVSHYMAVVYSNALDFAVHLICMCLNKSQIIYGWISVYNNWKLLEMQLPKGACLQPEGHSHWKRVLGFAAVMIPFFQVSRRSLAYQFTVNAPLLWPPFSIFRKFLDFHPYFGQNSSSLDPNFSEFSFPRPAFFKENPLPRPYILKPTWHTEKKSWVPPIHSWFSYK